MQAEKQQETTDQSPSRPIAEEKSRTSTTINYSSAGGERVKLAAFMLLSLSHFLNQTAGQALLPAEQKLISFTQTSPYQPSASSLVSDAESAWETAVETDYPAKRQKHEEKSPPLEESKPKNWVALIGAIFFGISGTHYFFKALRLMREKNKARLNTQGEKEEEAKDSKRIKKEEKHWEKRKTEYMALMRTLLILKQSADPAITAKAEQIDKKYTDTGGYSINNEKKIKKEIKELEALALTPKRKLEGIFQDYAKRKLLLENLNKQIEQLKIRCPGYKMILVDMGGKLNAIEDSIANCDQLMASLKKKIEENENPYIITEQDYSSFAKEFEPLAEIIDQNATLVQLIPEVAKSQNTCTDLLQKLQGSSEMKEAKKSTQATTNFFVSLDIDQGVVGRWEKVINTANKSKQQLSRQPLIELTKRISEAQLYFKKLRDEITQLREFQKEMTSLQGMTDSRLQQIITRMEETAKMVKSTESQLKQLERSLPEQKNSPNTNPRKNKRNPPTAPSQFQQSNTFFAKSDEQKDAEAKKKNVPLPKLKTIVSMTETMLDEKEAKTDDITLNYYRHIAVIYVSLKNILEMEKKLPKYVTTDSAWEKIQNIYNNLTENPGILQRFPKQEDARAAGIELVKMIRKISEGETISEAFKTPQSKLLETLMTDTNRVEEKPPHIGAKIPKPSSASLLVAWKYLQKHIFKQEVSESVTLTSTTLS